MSININTFFKNSSNIKRIMFIFKIIFTDLASTSLILTVDILLI